MKYVFDLDGTLVDTRRAVFEAYKMAGAIMPDDAWGKPAREWLPQLVGEKRAEAVHHLKVVAYPAMLVQYVKPLPLLGYALHTESPIITGASANSVMIVNSYVHQFLTHSRNKSLAIAGFSLSALEKAEWLQREDRFYTENHAYVDDDPAVRQIVKERTTWMVLSPEEVLQRWSSRRGPTLV